MTNLSEISLIVIAIALALYAIAIQPSISTPAAPVNRQSVKGASSPAPINQKRAGDSSSFQGAFKRITPPVSSSSSPTAVSNKSKLNISDDENAGNKFQARMMRPEMQQQQLQVAVAGSNSQNYYGSNTDTWQAHNSMPTFTDQEQGDEMVAVASESEPEHVKAPITALRSTLSPVLDKEDSLADLAPSRSEPEKSTSAGQSRLVAGARRPSTTDDYYPDDEGEDDEELNKSLSRDEYETPASMPIMHDPPKEQTKPYINNQEQQKRDQVDNSRKQSEQQRPQPQQSPNSSPESYGMLQPIKVVAPPSSENGWLPSTRNQPVSTGSSSPKLAQQQQSKPTAQVQQQQDQQPLPKPTEKRRPRERLVDLFGGRDSYGGAFSKTDAAIEYLRNILKTKQSQNSTSPLKSIRQSSNSEDIFTKDQKFDSMANSNLSDILNGTSASSENSTMNESQEYNLRVPMIKPNEPYEFTGSSKKNQLSIGVGQQAGSKFSIGDAKSTNQALGMEKAQVDQSQYMATLTSTTTRLPGEERAYSLGPQMISLSGALPERVAQANSFSNNQQQQQFNFDLPSALPNGTPLGGDFIENLDELPRGYQQKQQQPSTKPPTQQQQQVTKMSIPNSTPGSQILNEQKLFEEGLRKSMAQQAAAEQQQHINNYRQQNVNQQHPMSYLDSVQYQQQPATDQASPSNRLPRFQPPAQDYLQSAGSMQQSMSQEPPMSASQQLNYQHPPTRPLDIDSRLRPMPMSVAESQIHQQVIPAYETRENKTTSANEENYRKQAPVKPEATFGEQYIAANSKLYRANEHSYHQQQVTPLPQTPRPEVGADSKPASRARDAPPKVKPPKIVSYNYFESPSEPGESELLATNYQLGDSLLSSTGGVEQVLSNVELEAIQNQFMTLDHPIVPLADQSSSANNNQQQQPMADQPETSLAGLLANFKPNLQPDALQKLTSSSRYEDVMRESASNEEPISVMPLPKNNHQQQHSSNFFKQNLPKVTDTTSDKKKKSLIVYLNHPRSNEMSSKSAQSADELGIAQSIGDQPIDPFVTAKEFDSQGLSKDSKHLDISSLKGFGGDSKDGLPDKDGLSVVVIGDAYKYKKIVLLISSKSGGLKFIPMVKDMRK